MSKHYIYFDKRWKYILQVEKIYNEWGNIPQTSSLCYFTYNNYSYMYITIKFSTQHSRNRISQVCTAHRDVRQFSTPWQVNICMLIRLRNSCRARRMRRKEHGTIDGGWKIHLHDVTKGDARQNREGERERVSVITCREMKWEKERKGKLEHKESEEEGNAAEGFEGNESHHYE